MLGIVSPFVMAFVSKVFFYKKLHIPFFVFILCLLFFFITRLYAHHPVIYSLPFLLCPSHSRVFNLGDSFNPWEFSFHKGWLRQNRNKAAQRLLLLTHQYANVGQHTCDYCPPDNQPLVLTVICTSSKTVHSFLWQCPNVRIVMHTVTSIHADRRFFFIIYFLPMFFFHILIILICFALDAIFFSISRVATLIS